VRNLLSLGATLQQQSTIFLGKEPPFHTPKGITKGISEAKKQQSGSQLICRNPLV
jgi:hypothetical protein